MANSGGKNPFNHPYSTKPSGGLLRGKRPFDDPFSPSLFDKNSGPQKQVKREETIPKGGNDHWWNEIPGHELCGEEARTDPTTEFQKSAFPKVAYDEQLFYNTYLGFSKRTTEDGVFYMEIEEEERTVGESLHTSKGTHDKGHSVTTKQSSYGRVDSMEIDELAGFDENGKAKAVRVSSRRSTSFNLRQDTGSNSRTWYDVARRGGRPFTSLEHYGGQPDGEPQVPPSREASRRNVPIE